MRFQRKCCEQGVGLSVREGRHNADSAGVTTDARSGLVCLVIVVFWTAPYGCERSSPSSSPSPPPPPAQELPPPVANVPSGPDALREEIGRLDAKIQADPGQPGSYIARGVLRRKLAWYEFPKGELGLYELALEDFRQAHEFAGGDWPPRSSAEPLAKAEPAVAADAASLAIQSAELRGSARALVEAGRIMLKVERPREALAFFRAAARFNSSDPEVRIELARLPGLRHHDWRTARQQLQELSGDPTLGQSTDLWLSLGIACQQMRDAERAIAAYRRAIALDPNNGAARTNLALVLLAADRVEAAQQQFRENLKANPNDLRSATSFSQYLIEQGYAEVAVGIMRSMVRRAPSEPDACFHLGNAYLANQQEDEAIEAFERSTELAPDRPSGFYEYGMGLLSVGNQAEALSALEAAVALQPDLPPVLCGYARALWATGQADRAEQVYRYAVESDPTNADAWCDFGEYLAAQKRGDEARKAFERAVRADADHARALCNLGWAWSESGKPNTAARYFRKALAAVPDHETALRGLCVSLRRQEKYDELLRTVDQVAAAFPEQLTARRWRAAEYLRRDNYERALADYSHIVERSPDARAQLNRAFLCLLIGKPWREVRDEFQAAQNLNIGNALPSLYVWIFEMEHGSSGRARRAVSLAARRAAVDSWYRRIAKYYAGDVSQAELLASAGTRERRCEAYYYIAEKTRVERGFDEAEVWFRKCREQGVHDYWEDRLARWRLSGR